MGTISAIALAAVGSTGLFAFLQFLIQRKDTTSDRLEKIQKNLEKAERDSCRIQLLIMINHYPENTTEILKLSEHYFVDLKANWYMTSIFNKWLEKNNIGKPEWFNED